MIVVPVLPLDMKTQEIVNFCLKFGHIAGFVQVYETKLAELYMEQGKKKGIKSAAYEATEQLYCQLLNRGRAYTDAETFFNARRNYYKRVNGKS